MRNKRPVGAKFWQEYDGWRGWRKENNTYYFNDIPDTIVNQINYMSDRFGNAGEHNSTRLEFIDNDTIHL